MSRTRAPFFSHEPAPHPTGSAGSLLPAPDPVQAAVEIARAWAGEGCLAVLLGGSHARGDALWVDQPGGPVCLSDVDLWVVVRDERAKREALSRAAAARPGLSRRLRDLGLDAPLDAGFYTPRDLELLPARPSTVELRAARVVYGDPSYRERVPAFRDEDVSSEEMALLLENRGLELLLAWFDVESPDAIARARARHAVTKVAADAARVLRRTRLADVVPQPPLRASRSEDGDEWLPAARAWVSVWLAFTARLGVDDPDPYERAMIWARRARIRRRIRQALSVTTRSGSRPPLWTRLSHAMVGTPVHRVNASAAILLISAAHGTDGRPALGATAARALSRLGVTAARAWDLAAREITRAWDLLVLDGQRTAERS